MVVSDDAIRSQFSAHYCWTPCCRRKLVMKSGQLDITFARVARDQGMQTAEDHANDEKHEWSNEAYAMLLKYLETHSEPFQTEQVRDWSDSMGLSFVSNPKAWGPVMTRACKAGVIIRIG